MLQKNGCKALAFALWVHADNLLRVIYRLELKLAFSFIITDIQNSIT